MWDLGAENPAAAPRVFRGHEAGVHSVAISADGHWLATGSQDGRWLVTGGDDGVLRLWDLNLESLLDRARRAAARELTAEERKQYLVDDPAQES